MYRFVPVVVLLLTPPAIAHEAESPTQIADAVVAAIEIIDAKHINPPTKQEMLKRVISTIRHGAPPVKAVVRKDGSATGQTVPQPRPNWSKRSLGISSFVSKLSTAEEFHAAVVDELTNESNRQPQVGPGDDSLMRILSSIGVQVQGSREAAVQKQIQANRYVGIGIGIRMQADTPVMAQVLPGGAAQKAGALKDDSIVAVDGKPTKGVPLRTVVEWLRGQQGSSVEVRLQRNGKRIDMTFVRDVVPIQTVNLEYQNGDGGTIAIIRLDRISASSVHEFRKLEREMHDNQIVGILLDLRRLNSVSAPLHETKLLADALIANRTIGYQLTRDSEHEFTAGPMAMFDGMPIVVLADSIVSGPGEWLVAALQQGRGATVVGTATAGRGYAIDDFAIPGTNYSLTMATSVLQTPDRRTLVSAIPTAKSVAVTSITQMERQAIAARGGAFANSKRADRLVGRVVPDHWIDSQRTGPNEEWIAAGVKYLRLIVAGGKLKNPASRSVR